MYLHHLVLCPITILFSHNSQEFIQFSIVGIVVKVLNYEWYKFLTSMIFFKDLHGLKFVQPQIFINSDT